MSIMNFNMTREDSLNEFKRTPHMRSWLSHHELKFHILDQTLLIIRNAGKVTIYVDIAR